MMAGPARWSSGHAPLRYTKMLALLFEWHVDLSCSCMTLFPNPIGLCCASLFCMFWVFFLIVFNVFIYLFLALLGLPCCAGFSVVAETRGYLLAVVLGLSGCGFWAVEHRLKSCVVWA